ncbi:hypothetical protein A2230_04215 [candidate division WOR-1 bacterium RIFOXYA2_FULL_36_21]|uniref:Potassium transporter TrkA n=1 Tax=candidate division WOR-1 bacterium RIFOXYB2_FULL_36_35 TaxID=1802578 RepID=A0A1F4RYB9_UNCSA|nr:MAG: hypothetical protein A2230_04215 [candidate division WOR-1 bacterium RIFOXYA2_FULL_36_21]OGC13149.1 MAG: hypothetical protein A2290_07560 [candidate division WOR-1 bacterium RIFOXYB2_FULL_36_35]OGC16921.1 MAG: hypothetical protein A2282_05715 [candidate division WOR-1 bacterium RIFOXYA12_FULL_36_13]
MSNPFNRLIIPILLLFAIICGGVFGYVSIEKWTPLDSLYMVVITLSTVGFREVYALSQAGKILTMCMIIGGVGVMGYSIGQIGQIIIEGELLGYRRRRRMERKIKEMKNHYIICGYGRVGHEVVKELNVFKIPYVIIDEKQETARELSGDGVPFIVGNITSDENLEIAGIKTAKGLIAAADSDTDNVFVTISARVLNPNIYIVARSGASEIEAKLLRAGANRVLSPYLIAGKKMADMVLRPVATDFIDKALDGDHLKFEVRELYVYDKSGVAGKNIGESQLRKRTGAHIAAIKRPNGSFILQPVAESKLEVGDILVAFGSPKQLDTLQDLVK